MFTFGLIALLGMAQADTPKKKSDKTEKNQKQQKRLVVNLHRIRLLRKR